MKTLHQPLKLLLTDGTKFLFRPQPLKFSILKPFVRNQESVVFPEQCFDPVVLSLAEKKEYEFERVHFKMVLNQGCKPVDRFSHICYPQAMQICL